MRPRSPCPRGAGRTEAAFDAWIALCWPIRRGTCYLRSRPHFQPEGANGRAGCASRSSNSQLQAPSTVWGRSRSTRCAPASGERAPAAPCGRVGRRPRVLSRQGTDAGARPGRPALPGRRVEGIKPVEMDALKHRSRVSYRSLITALTARSPSACPSARSAPRRRRSSPLWLGDCAIQRYRAPVLAGPDDKIRVRRSRPFNGTTFAGDAGEFASFEALVSFRARAAGLASADECVRGGEPGSSQTNAAECGPPLADAPSTAGA